MLDIKWIRDNPKEFDNLMSKRGIEPISDQILFLDEEKRQTITIMQQLQHARKEKSKQLSQIKDVNSPEFHQLKSDAQDIKEKLDEFNNKEFSQTKLTHILENLPNIPDEDVPYGVDELGNVEIKKYGSPKDIESPKNHFELGENLGMMDFVQTAKISGSRFVTLKSDLSLLERALYNFMLDTHTKEYGFMEVSPPFLVKDIAMYGAGQLPKFDEDSFKTTNDMRLIPTAEVSLVNMVADIIIPREKLPMRLTAHTPCFRSEAGSAGKDTRGMIRLHQFSKVELVSITSPEDSKNEHEYLLNAAESILQKLDLPYRVMLLCSGDMGFSAQKTYDLEVWMPAQKKYREISSVSNCGNFQARRMKARYKEVGSTTTTFPHTLNGSGLAIGRTIAAIVENYQQKDGSIIIPEILRNYMGGIDRIKSLEL